MKGIDIQQLDSEDADDAFSLHNRLLGGKRTKDDWFWEYDGYESGRSVFIVGKKGKKIIGTQGMLPVHISINGKTYLSGKSENSVVDTKYRGKGLFKDMYGKAMDECQEKGMVSVWGFTTAVEVMRDNIKFKVYPDKLQRAVIPLKFGITKEQVKSGFRAEPRGELSSIILAMGAITVSSFKRLFKKPKIPKAKFKICRKPKKWQDLDNLYDELNTEYPRLIHIAQNEEYVNWRIFNNPNNDHKSFFLYSGKELKGYAYLTNRNGIGELTDFTFLDAGAGAYILSEIMQFAVREKLGILIYSGNTANKLNNTVFDLLDKFGSIQRPRDAFVLKNISYSKEKELYDIKNWYLNDLWNEGT